MAKRISKKAQRELEVAARREAREVKLAPMRAAIREGRAYLDTAFGRHTVLGYNDDTGDCVTVPEGKDSYLHRRTFMVCSDAIKF